MLIHALLATAGLVSSSLVLAADQIPLDETPTHSQHHDHPHPPKHHDYPTNYLEDNDYLDKWNLATQKANTFLTNLTLPEKLTLITGNSFSGPCVGSLAPLPPSSSTNSTFRGLCMSDGPQAINHADLISIFPSGITAAATFSRSLLYRRGRLMGSEFYAKGIHVHLGPVAGPLGRHARGGRNWEGYGPDPYLTGAANGISVRGLQDAGVQTTVKHFIGNEQETMRQKLDPDYGPGDGGTDAISVNMDDKTLHELYLWPFAEAIRAGATGVMCSYNRVNGTYACENEHLLRAVLREELGFRGYVVSDWWATHSTVDSANGGLDLEMPGEEDREGKGDAWFGSRLQKAVIKGNVKEERIDEMVRSVMTPYFLLEQDEEGFPEVDQSIAWVAAVTKFGWDSKLEGTLPPFTEARDIREDHKDFIREMGAAGTVLLKNEDRTLPLQKPKTIGVFGNGAGSPADGGYRDLNFEMGTLDIGGGSGSGRHSRVVTPLDAITRKAEEIGSRVTFVLNNELLATGDTRMIYPKPDVCLVFVKAWAGERYDRPSLSVDWDGDAVIESIASWCNNTVVVVHAGGVVLMPWSKHPNVTAVLVAHYPGEETGNSIVDILWGHVNPSGKLPYTVPEREDDYAPPLVTKPDDAVGRIWNADFDEGLMIDYRHFDRNDIRPMYEFGFGLSYTEFEIGIYWFMSEDSIVGRDGGDGPRGHGNGNGDAELSLSSLPNTTLGKKPGGWIDLWTVVATAVVQVTNIGIVPGHAVVQLYMTFPRSGKGDEDDEEPPQVLRGFERVWVESGRAAEVRFPLRRRDLSVWDVERQEWRIPKGRFGLRAGFSSRDFGGGGYGVNKEDGWGFEVV